MSSFENQTSVRSMGWLKPLGLAAGALALLVGLAAALNGAVLLWDLRGLGRYAPEIQASVQQSESQMNAVLACGRGHVNCIRGLSPHLTQPLSLLAAAGELPVTDTHSRLRLLLRAQALLATPEAQARTSAMQRVLADLCRFQSPFQDCDTRARASADVAATSVARLISVTRRRDRAEFPRIAA